MGAHFRSLRLGLKRRCRSSGVKGSGSSAAPLGDRRVGCRGRCPFRDVRGFGLAYLLGIELMPRIRRWRHLRLYRTERDQRYAHIDRLLSGTVNWTLIREHYATSMQLALAIQGGTLAPSAVLAWINSYSTRNRFALALQELGVAVRTRFLLEWIMDDAMRRTVHRCTM